MQAQLYQRFCKLAYDKAGISLKAGKEALVTARVTKRVRALQLADAAAYIDFLEAEDDGVELLRFLDVISTHFTSFFREPDHFDELERVAKDWSAQGQKRFRFWSAASSTGEEPWSMAMTLHHVPGFSGLDWKILATDIAADTLAQAEGGVYATDRVGPVPKGLKAKYLVRAPDPAGKGVEHFGIADHLRAHVAFRRLNLAQLPYPMKGPFDVVFCRNVFIYFDQPTRQRIVSAIEALMRPSGLFLLGHTETLNGIATRLKMIRPSVFQKPAEGSAR